MTNGGQNCVSWKYEGGPFHGLVRVKTLWDQENRITLPW